MKASTAAALAVLLLGTSGAMAQSVPDFADDVKRVAEGDLQTWITDPVIVYALNEQNEKNDGIRAGKIKFLDETWIAENGRGPMIFDLLDRQASVIVRDRRELSNGVITEIIVMDKYGLNVAISDPTSDYYQGDEAKYQETFLKGPGAVHVSEIEFDDSTQKYQTQVSMTVVDPASGEPIGAVTFGIDLDVLKAQRPSQ
ncbi:cache domain-containing protein [Limibaculum sp. M0105]|uniref:Cache domain-containing protein n=1 Tax=Thermohalobaculum xanthum TaxID=2753746 RepID=A0A8J7M739_9RHOB|nr:PDC sensor domain-containing protein [Thermohalobaculum xanthum]MBK0398925.1 cache domain-containing protein [Thermohalobaculum xanthum]